MDKLIVRAHWAGAIMTDKKGAVITQVQLDELQKLKDRHKKFTDNPITNANSKLTLIMIEKIHDVTLKKNAPFELSDTAKAKIDEVWLRDKKGIPTIISSKYMEKGIYQEKVARELISQIDGRFYTRNEVRKTIGSLSGVCDVVDSSLIKRIVHDIKCCWNASTFMASKMDTIQEWQGRVYMEMWNADEFWLRFCLVDCPDHIMENELYRFKLNNGIIDDTLPEYQEQLENFRKTLIFSDNKKIRIKERVKTIVIERDKELFKTLQKRLQAVKKYYKSIKLNQLV